MKRRFAALFVLLATGVVPAAHAGEVGVAATEAGRPLAVTIWYPSDAGGREESGRRRWPARSVTRASRARSRSTPSTPGRWLCRAWSKRR